MTHMLCRLGLHQWVHVQFMWSSWYECRLCHTTKRGTR